MKTKMLRKSLALLLALCMLFTLWPAAAYADGSGAADPTAAAIAALLDRMADGYKGTADFAAAMSLAAYGRADNVAGRSLLENALDENNTNIAATIFALTALGVDASKVSVGEEVYHDFIDWLDKTPADIHGAINGLQALDCGNYRAGEFRKTLIDDICTYLVDKEYVSTPWGPDIDTPAMAITALAPYYSETEVAAAVDNALAWLKKELDGAEHYGNSCSTATVIVALAALGEDPGVLIEGLLTFRTETDQFQWMDGLKADDFSTEWAFRALVTYQKFVAGGNNPYNIYLFGRQQGNGTELQDPIINPSDPTKPDPTESEPKTITVYLSVRGLSGGGNEENWLSRKTVTLARGATVSAAVIQGLRESGYSENGLQSGIGYVKSVTRPDGFTLAEMHNGLPFSGWLYKVNNQLPPVGMDSHVLENDDHILLYFTKDYTQDPDAGIVPDGEKKPGAGTHVVKITPVIKDDVAVAAVDSGLIKEALDKLKDGDAKETRELKVEVAAVPGTSTSRVELKAGDVKVIAKAENVRLTITSANAALTFDAQTLAGMTKGVADNVTVAVTIAAVDTAKVDAERQTIIGSAPAVFDLGVMIGNTEAHELDRTATVFLPYVPAAGTDPAQLTVHHLGADFKVTPLKDAHYDAARGGFTFTTTHLSLFFIAEVTDTVVDEEWHNPFTDVQEKDWFFDVVKYININQLMAGATADEFSPRAPMTRAMLVTVLHRYEGEPTAAAADSFTDVGANAWYGNAVAWAAENGIVAGYGNHLFGTHDNVTREQMAAILCNYSARKGLDVSQTANLSAYTDADAVSPWAREAVGWAAASGLIRGRSAETLAPKGTATRAEAGAILMRYIEGNAA